MLTPIRHTPREPDLGRLAGLAGICIFAVAVFVWQNADFRGTSDSLAAYRSGLYLQPWRAISSGFIHQSALHLSFNLVTLWILGARTCRRYGTTSFLLVFLVSLFVGQVTYTLTSNGHVIGVSGGACGLYGYLLLKEWKNTLFQTLRAWSFFWVYPLLLIVLFGLDLTGLLTIANTSHVAGVATGCCCAFAAKSRWQKIPIALITIASVVLVVFRPWDPVWQSLHGKVSPSSLLPVSGCGAEPAIEVDNHAPALLVTILNPRRRQLVVSYFDANGQLVEALRFQAKARSLVPLSGSVWRVDDENGACVGQFAAFRDGVVALDPGD